MIFTSIKTSGNNVTKYSGFKIFTSPHIYDINLGLINSTYVHKQ